MGSDLLPDQLCRNTEALVPQDRIDILPLGIRRILDTHDCPIRLACAWRGDLDPHPRTDMLNLRHHIPMRGHRSDNRRLVRKLLARRAGRVMAPGPGEHTEDEARPDRQRGGEQAGQEHATPGSGSN